MEPAIASDCPEFDTAIPAGLRSSWEIARRNFGRRVTFFAPSLKRYCTDEFQQCGSCSFVPISVTGTHCALDCAHCQTRLLTRMRPATTPKRLLATAAELKRSGAQGLLVSGGCDTTGAVPLAGFLAAIKEIKEELGLQVAVHTGIADRSLAQGLARAGVDAAMIDIVGSDDTIREVYHLQGMTTEAYRRSLAHLSEAGVPLAPHVVFGLHFGQIKGEEQALQMIAGHDVAALVLVGLRPLDGTAQAAVTPPPPARLGELFAAARELLPHTPILLGCERPAGEHKLATDELALKAGLNGIAYPSEGIISLAQDLGLEPRRSELCCALLYQFLDDQKRSA